MYILHSKCSYISILYVEILLPLKGFCLIDQLFVTILTLVLVLLHKKETCLKIVHRIDARNTWQMHQLLSWKGFVTNSIRLHALVQSSQWSLQKGSISEYHKSAYLCSPNRWGITLLKAISLTKTFFSSFLLDSSFY